MERAPPLWLIRDSTQTAVIFHPKTIELMRFKADLLATPEEDLTEAAQEAKEAEEGDPAPARNRGDGG